MSTQKIPSASELLQHFEKYNALCIEERKSYTPINMKNIDHFVVETSCTFDLPASEAESIVRQMIKMHRGEYTAEIDDKAALIAITTATAEPTIEFPITKNELMLLAICVREYREQLRKTIEKTNGKKHWQVALIDQCNLLEQKLLSNEISYDTIHGKVGV